MTAETPGAAAPYAAIIIPIHARPETLGASVRSALDQTVQDIHVVLVGDGVTPACRRVARELEQVDPRVQFLDYPKAPFNGAANRDRAIREIAAERIFYNDDDDLLLPHHVEVLGPLLDEVDVVDTPVVSVRPDGLVDLGLHDSADPDTRASVASGDYKPVFDTHLAHRRSTYLRLDGPWAAAPDRRSVLHFLQSFAAADDVTWMTTQRITALSFHGARRATMPAWERRIELERWERRVRSGLSERELRQTGEYPFHLLRLVNALRRSEVSASQVRSRLDGIVEKIGDEAGRQAARDQLEPAIDLCFGHDEWDDRHDDAIVSLLAASLAPGFQVAGVLARYVRGQHVERIRRRLLADADSPAPTDTLALFWCSARAGSVDASEWSTRLDEVVETCHPSDRYGVMLEAGRIMLAPVGDPALARHWCDRALDAAPQTSGARGVWRLSLEIARSVGDRNREDQAAESLRRLDAGEPPGGPGAR